MKSTAHLPKEAEKAINDILGRGNDVLIKFREKKGEVEILEQKVSLKSKFKITE